MWTRRSLHLNYNVGSLEPPLEAATFGGGIMPIRRSVCEISSALVNEAANANVADLRFATADMNQIHCTISLC